MSDSSHQGPVFSTLPVELPEFYEVVGLFIQRLDERMQGLREAVDSKDSEQILELVHWLRGSGGNVGYSEYANLCNRMEQSTQQSLPALKEDFMAIESFNRRVVAGWETTPKPVPPARDE